ncbi:TIGR04086 family membrane protein [Cohnella zeiphila]|uniref:TIGR04086 family membrane protein n=1 Tax=Cohnella zeiphila TaxID=2761120 RepID=A0A7X0SG82_9BACL|nr:TIGR04086 family membrane protein [Cohnella zeiphila]MBB6729347.1 TIGR04086 family membrane protein [Cohnella zeiphila]
MKPVAPVTGFRIASPLLSGILWSVIWLAIGTIVLSLMLYGTSMAEADTVPWVFGIHGFASCCGGFVSARRAGHKGWSIGLGIGLTYAILVLISSFLAHDIGWTPRIALLLGIAAAAGAFGGMLGVNTGGGQARRK